MSCQDLPSHKTLAAEGSNPEQRYCICQKREDELYDQDDNNDFMIECDGCNGWFHGRCVSLADRIADDIEKYFCLECSKHHGPSILKQRRNLHRRDYSDAHAEHKVTQSGTKDFINKLKRKTFLNCESVITRLKGNQLTTEYLAEHGFNKPILVGNRDGLEVTLPNRSISLKEINELVGHDRDVDVIDCEKQVTYKMKLDDFIEYFESYERNKLYNVLSLEISNTKLAESVVTPKIVREISWCTNGIWPNKKNKVDDDMTVDEDNPSTKKVTWSLQSSLSKKKRRTTSSATDTDQSDNDEDLNANHFENFERPEVAKYCLMSPQSAYTDFHIDFGGSSVWYSVLRGEKIFYLIEPTDENLQKYADWSKSPNESETFLGDCVSHCYKMHLREENTVFIPAGWIHAVYTVTDSLVFGGNFLQSMGVDMQLRIYELELLAEVPHKFKYPLFETIHWYAAKAFYEELRECNNSNPSTINPVTQQAAEAIVYHLSRWLTADKRYQIRNRYIIPKGINCDKLLRDLSRELETAKTSCGASYNSKLPSTTIITNSIKVKLPLDNKQEFVQIGGNKIKVKCRREFESDKTKQSLADHGVKLTIKTATIVDRKGSYHDGASSTVTSKKKVGRPASSIKKKKKESDASPKVLYTLDLEAKRQRFIEASSFIEDDESTSDTTGSWASGKSPTDDADDTLCNADSGGLSSFVKRSVHENPSRNKHEHRASKKSKPRSADLEKKLVKKLKVEPISSTRDTSTAKSSSPTKKATPKNPYSKDRLGKILKIANSIKSRGGVLT